MMKRFLLTGCSALALVFPGCATVSPGPAPSAPPPPAVVGTARITGSEETSTLFDNFTAFIVAANGRPVAAGRNGWNTPVEIPAGRNTLAVEFNRGNFMATAELELAAGIDANYELKFATDTKIFGQNSYCEFWIVDAGTGQAVTPVSKVPVKKR